MSERGRDTPSSSAPPRAVTGDRAEEAEAPTTARQLQVTGGFLTKIPVVMLSPADLNAADLDHREYFLLSLMDPETTLDDIIDICGMPSEEALALLDSMARRGIILLTD